MVDARYSGFLNTPLLWTGKQLETEQFRFPSLSLDGFNPDPIPPKIRLGHQMEHVFQQLIAHSDNYNIVVANLPIRRGGRTLGEIDFIIEDESLGRLIHVELTYKFYIIDPRISDPLHQLIGPNRRDAYHMKMEKIRDRQFSLLHTEEGIEALIHEGIDNTKVEHQCCFKAQLYHQYGTVSVDIGTLNQDCIAGTWLRMDDFRNSEFRDAQYYIPTKSEWVIHPHEEVVWKSHNDIIIDIQESLVRQRSPLLWIKRSGNNYEKTFVVWW